MDLIVKNFKHRSFIYLVISSLAIFLLFAWQGNKGFSLWDEGFLWYGVQRVLLGEVPIRDFMAYDPGRYYWSAALLSITGDNGIMSVRVAVAIFQTIGLFVGLFLVASSSRPKDKPDIFFWLVSAITLALWMFPRHKLFDISLSIFLIGILTHLIKNPTPKRYLLAGIVVGLTAVFGRNHGMYGAVSSLGVIAWLNIKHRSGPSFLSGFLFWSIGVFIGFLPIILMAALIPGFATSYWESIRFLFELKGTNLPLSVPWPWTINFQIQPFSDALRGFVMGWIFIATLIFGVISLLWVIYKKYREQQVQATLVATAFLANPYAHFAFSRADLGHLAQGIFPFLIGTLVIASGATTKIKWMISASLLVASFWVIFVAHPGWYCFSSKSCVNVEVSGSNLLVDPGTAADIALLRQLADEYAPDGQTFIATPFWPGAYALLNRKSPMWEIYALFPRSEAFEIKELERIKVSNPQFAFVFDLPLDGREELRFKNTHPLIHQYLKHLSPVTYSSNPSYQIYKARGEG